MSGTELIDIECPYCGETLSIVVDCSVESQGYIEDCQVCCRPMNLTVTVDEDGLPQVQTHTEDEV